MSEHEDPEKIHRVFSAIMRAAGWTAAALGRPHNVYMHHHVSLIFMGFQFAWRYLHGAEIADSIEPPLAASAAPVVALSVETAPAGSVAPCEGGGWWARTKAGWKWKGPNGNGTTLPAPGEGWTGRITAPQVPPPADGEPIPFSQYALLMSRLNAAIAERDAAIAAARSQAKEIQS